MKTLLLIIVGAALANNVVLSQFLGLCPFLGVSKKIKTAAGMGVAVIFVITVSSLVTSVIYKFVLANEAVLGGSLTYLNTICFILIIAALVQLVELVLKKYSPALHKALGVYLPLITTNCAVLGVALNNVTDFDVTKGSFIPLSVLSGFCVAVGFMFAILILAGIREKTEDNDIPKSFKGMPATLVTAGLMAMAFMGFQGLV